MCFPNGFFILPAFRLLFSLLSLSVYNLSFFLALMPSPSSWRAAHLTRAAHVAAPRNREQPRGGQPAHMHGQRQARGLERALTAAVAESGSGENRSPKIHFRLPMDRTLSLAPKREDHPSAAQDPPPTGAGWCQQPHAWCHHAPTAACAPNGSTGSGLFADSVTWDEHSTRHVARREAVRQRGLAARPNLKRARLRGT